MFVGKAILAHFNCVSEANKFRCKRKKYKGNLTKLNYSIFYYDDRVGLSASHRSTIPKSIKKTETESVIKCIPYFQKSNYSNKITLNRSEWNVLSTIHNI